MYQAKPLNDEVVQNMEKRKTDQELNTKNINFLLVPCHKICKTDIFKAIHWSMSFGYHL